MRSAPADRLARHDLKPVRGENNFVGGRGGGQHGEKRSMDFALARRELSIPNFGPRSTRWNCRDGLATAKPQPGR